MHKLLKVIWLPLNPHIHGPWFQLYTLFDPTLDFLNVSMTMVFHPIDSHVPPHIQMILGSSSICSSTSILVFSTTSQFSIGS